MKAVDLQNLPKDPAIEANVRPSKKVSKIETEDDGVNAGTLRILKVRHQARAFRDQSKTKPTL